MESDAPIDPEAVELSQRLLDAMGFDRRLGERVDRLGAVDRARERASKAAKGAIEVLRARQRLLLTPEMVRPAIVEMYARHLTVSELRQLVSFFESSVAKKWLSLDGAREKALEKIITEAFRAQEATMEAEVLKRLRTREPTDD